MKMTQRPALAVLAAAAALASACSSLEVTSDWDKTVDFSPYRTYAYKGGTPAEDEMSQRRLEAGLEKAMAKRGIKKVDAGADVNVFLHTRVNTQTEFNTTNYGGSSVGWVGWSSTGGWSSTVGSQTTVSEIEVGKVVVDVVDPKRTAVVWRGYASFKVGNVPADQSRVDSGFEKLMGTFPPKGKK